MCFTEEKGAKDFYMFGLPFPVAFLASLMRLGRKKGTLSASPPPATPRTRFPAPSLSCGGERCEAKRCDAMRSDAKRCDAKRSESCTKGVRVMVTSGLRWCVCDKLERLNTCVHSSILTLAFFARALASFSLSAAFAASAFAALQVDEGGGSVKNGRERK